MVKVEVLDHRIFLQELVRRFGFGYLSYSLTLYPLKKEAKWQKIDEKLVNKYPILGLNKYQRARRKRQGLLNGMVLRYRQFLVIQVTKGKDDLGIKVEERFRDLRDTRLVLPDLYRDLSFRIGWKNNQKITVFIEKGRWREIKAYWFEKAAKATRASIENEWREFDRLAPSWSGIYGQKVILRQLIRDRAQKRGLKDLKLEISLLRARKVRYGM